MLKKTIALYGGSFDPPHKSHIALIKYLERLTYIDQVWLLPCGDRTDKKLILSKQKRFNLMKKIFQTNQDIKVVDYEVQMSKSLGRMIHTYQLLQNLAKQFQNYKFYFVIGGDIVQGLQTWGNGKELKKQFDFIIFNRKGFLIKEEYLPVSYKMELDQLEEMSSSSIKKVLLDEGMSKQQKFKLIRDFVPVQAIECLRQEKIL